MNKQTYHFEIKHPVNLRADAAWVLYQILENGQSSREIMPIVWARHQQANDRAWLQQMVFGCLRNLPRLQVWMRQLLHKPLKKNQKIIEHLLMLGMYQLAYARTADHAAVSETVAACKQMKEIGLSGLVNAVLRSFMRDNIQDQEINEAHVKYGLPKWIYKSLLTHYPEQIASIAENMQTRAALWLRVNTSKVSAEQYCDALKEQQYTFEHHGDAIKLLQAGEVTQLPGYEAGWFAVQDLAAQQAARLLNPQANDVILDCCAAPGGKTAGIIEAQPQLKQLIALDAQANRVSRIHENLARLGHSAAHADQLKVIVADAQALDQLDLPKFDRILLDAPCSATGVIRRHPDIMWLRKRSDIDVLVNLQKTILEQVWQQLKVGGTLVYATCSILPQENTQQIQAFLATHANAKLQPITTTSGETVDCWQIMPGEENMDGFFYATLLKCE
ncbi:MAG: 16S rRNA (cytosine(967)-C(5))-methyltransferase RsmB [Glaciecola sp.]